MEKLALSNPCQAAAADPKPLTRNMGRSCTQQSNNESFSPEKREKLKNNLTHIPVSINLDLMYRLVLSARRPA
ncbi:MAG: hypothetical protein ACP5F3_05995 [Candidatus Syntrophosphaera sp.]